MEAGPLVVMPRNWDECARITFEHEGGLRGLFEAFRAVYECDNASTNIKSKITADWFVNHVRHVVFEHYFLKNKR